LRSVTVFGG